MSFPEQMSPSVVPTPSGAPGRIKELIRFRSDVDRAAILAAVEAAEGSRLVVIDEPAKDPPFSGVLAGLKDDGVVEPVEVVDNPPPALGGDGGFRSGSVSR